MQHLGSEIRQFRRLFKADGLDPQRVGANPGVGCHDAIHVGPDLNCFGFQTAADKLEKSSADGAYAKQATAVASSLRSEANAKRSSPASVIADAIGKAVTARRPKTRYATGFGAKPLITLRRILPDRAFDTVISRAVGMSR